jgi:hypothetical protein
MPVNPVVSAPERWEAAGDPLIQQIRASPYVMVVERGRAGEAV